MWRSWYDFLQALFPFACLLCGCRAGWREVLCRECASSLRKSLATPREVRDVVSTIPLWTLGAYAGPLAQAVKVAKYRPSRRLAEHLADLMCETLQACAGGLAGDVVIPVPLHELRESRRGFNQARLLAEGVARAWGCPVSPAIVRQTATRPQAECDEQERIRNLRGAFQLHPRLEPEHFRNKRIWLIDDVATTGHTIEESSLPLRGLGGMNVSALVLAHSYRQCPAAPSVEAETRLSS